MNIQDNLGLLPRLEKNHLLLGRYPDQRDAFHADANLVWLAPFIGHDKWNLKLIPRSNRKLICLGG
jgi:hypothetical protein